MINDNGAIVLGWLTKIALSAAVLGFIGFDGVVMVRDTFANADHANTYASEAADVYKTSKDVNKAYGAVAAEAEKAGDSISPQTFTIDPNGEVHLILRHTAVTLWMYRIPPLKKYTEISSSASASPIA